ncbi:MAG: hypothetical protein ACOCPM_06855 [Bacteroidales bacterium]
MQKILSLFLIGILFFAISSCEEDTVDPTPEVQRVMIDRVEIPHIPFQNSNGDDWDSAFDPKPDVYFKITKDTVENLPDSLVLLNKRSANYSEVSQGDLPLTWSLVNPFEISDWNMPFYVQVFDRDPITDDDFMGVAGSFRIEDIIDDQPESTIMSAGDLQVEIFWIYEE